MHGDQNIRGLDVPVDDSFLMSVMDSFADVFEQFEPLFNIELTVITVPGDRHAFDMLHNKIWPTCASCAGVKYVGYIRMIQQGKCLAFGLETGDNLFGIHTRLDDFQSDPAFDRLFLLGQIYQTHAAFADQLQQFVPADFRAGTFNLSLPIDSHVCINGGSFEIVSGLLMCP